MTTPLSTTQASNKSLSTVNPQLAKANGAENQTEKPLSPETEEALARWTPKQRESLFSSKEDLQHPLTQYLANPVKSMLNNVFCWTLLPLAGYEALSRILPNAKVPFMGNMTLKGFKTFVWFAILTTTGIFSAVPEYFSQKWVNQDILKGIKTLGTHASKQDWNDYQKAHPEITNG